MAQYRIKDVRLTAFPAGRETTPQKFDEAGPLEVERERV